MNKAIGVVGGLGIGAALMYLFDPDQGNRRRALIRDKAIGFNNKAQRVLGARARDLRNRAKGLLHETTSALKPAETEAAGQESFSN